MPHFYLHADFFSSPKRKDRRHQKKEPNISQLNPMKRKGSPVINGEDLESPMESPRGEKLRKSHHIAALRRGMEALQEETMHHSLKHECKYQNFVSFII